MRNGILLLKFCKSKVWSDLAKLIVFLQQFCNLCFVGRLVYLISTVELLYIVHETKNAVDLLLVLETSFLRTTQMDGLVH